MARLPNYLRKFRKRSGLSQAELTFLLGAEGGAKVCRYERFLREPSLRTALAFEVVFKRPIADLFPGLRDEMEILVQGRAKRLSMEGIQGRPAEIARKQQTVEGILDTESKANQPTQNESSTQK